MRGVFAAALLVACAGAGQAQSGFEARWNGLVFLMGNWTGEGGGAPGQGTGNFSFQADLNGQVVVRRNSNQLSGGSKHEDLMVIYSGAPDGAFRAIYFDSEGN